MKMYDAFDKGLVGVDDWIPPLTLIHINVNKLINCAQAVAFC